MEPQPQTSQTPNPEIEKVKVQLLTFTSLDPELFFSRAEVNFLMAGVSSHARKYSHIMSVMDE